MIEYLDANKIFLNFIETKSVPNMLLLRQNLLLTDIYYNLTFLRDNLTYNMLATGSDNGASLNNKNYYALKLETRNKYDGTRLIKFFPFLKFNLKFTTQALANRYPNFRYTLQIGYYNNTEFQIYKNGILSGTINRNPGFPETTVSFGIPVPENSATFAMRVIVNNLPYGIYSDIATVISIDTLKVEYIEIPPHVPPTVIYEDIGKLSMSLNRAGVIPLGGGIHYSKEIKAVVRDSTNSGSYKYPFKPHIYITVTIVIGPHGSTAYHGGYQFILHLGESAILPPYYTSFASVRGNKSVLAQDYAQTFTEELDLYLPEDIKEFQILLTWSNEDFGRMLTAPIPEATVEYLKMEYEEIII